MAQQVTLGGERLGSGNKQKINLHPYEMTSFNLDQDWKSSMAPGILYPFLKLVGTNHGTFDIDLDSFIRTLPTKGPLFGQFKFQADIFCVPMRLYQGILHNNPVGIGMKMNQVYLPKLEFKTVDYINAPRALGSNDYNYQVNESALLKYMGISGAGRKTNRTTSGNAVRKFQCVPMLAYYDIFKCYYSNKQEDNAYVITPGDFEEVNYDDEFTGAQIMYQNTIDQNVVINTYEDHFVEFGILLDKTFNPNDRLVIGLKNTNWRTIKVNIWSGETHTVDDKTLGWCNDNNILVQEASIHHPFTGHNYVFRFGEDPSEYSTITLEIEESEQPKVSSNIKLTPFALKNIDDMRNALLSSNELGSEFVLGASGDWTATSGSDSSGLPYSALFNTTTEGITWNAFEDNGLMVKTYQSDLFNNWLNTEYIDGESGISALTAVSVSDGSFTIDSLNLAEKIYEVLNRVAVSGGTYEDWQEAVYGEGAVRKAETPMYMGGMSAEVMFEEVISQAETDLEEGEGYQPLGSLGGKGTQVGKKGGNNIHIKCEEPCYIIGIASLTPRISYSQGNDWDITELDTLDDLHKPALDGIGFQDLIVEQMAWWDTRIIEQQSNKIDRRSAGKQTAWINYQTAVDKCFGDFARQEGNSFMVLNRNYEMVEDNSHTATVKDITTYIDPAKFNYAFAVTDLAAQNFWVQIHSRVVARRKMGAQQIPNL